ncbi:type II secretory pathway, pseudopilin PulG [Halovibrio salipaludis]|uniref:Type II secretory pathway, pseudopilin PulG n=2 Tax=Halovibrio salipaludis TaxID=2032626 RepID=A0A2A2ESG5_9GAMM|nr:type II secretory pathway, pseudopilin PulG [Halovibrio salipaludis]
MVLILIGVLSSLGIGLLISPGGYSASVARDQFVSTALLAQKHALAAGPSTRISLSFGPSDEGFTFTVTRHFEDEPSIVVAERTVDASGLSVDPRSLSLDYGSTGGLSSSSGKGVTFTSESTHQACISSLGFPYTGSCQ